VSLKNKLRRRRLAQLNQVHTAAPCSVDWDEMPGDDKVRSCQACRLSVYNLSAMDVEEAAERIAQDDDRLCVRFYRRRDGTILTQDCPVGVESTKRKRRGAVLGTAAALAGVAGMVLMPTMETMPRPIARAHALRAAAAQGNLAGLTQLLDAGIDLNTSPKDGRTALMAAAARGQVEAVRLLLSRGADVNARDHNGETALQLARAEKHSRVAALLKKAGAAE
jgi:hypothetical protein